MGSTLSCIHGNSGSVHQSQQPAPPEPARVIAPDGTLKEVPASDPLASVSDVLGSGASFFLCNSDELYFNEPPPALAAAERLRPGQMYFVLPAEILRRPLSNADMAALAVRATSAIGPGDDNPPRRRRRCLVVGNKRQVRVVPVTREQGNDRDEQSVFYGTLNELTLGGSAVFTAAARSAEKVVAVGTTEMKKSSAFTRMMSMIREDAE